MAMVNYKHRSEVCVVSEILLWDNARFGGEEMRGNWSEGIGFVRVCVRE